MKDKGRRTKDEATAAAIARARAELAPETPCVNADAEGYCTGPCEGSICCQCADYRPAKKDEGRRTKDEGRAIAKRDAAGAPAKAGFAEVLAADDGRRLDASATAECVRAHLSAAALFGRLSLAHAIAAGWLLYTQRIHMAWGEWGQWCGGALGVSQQTANKYISLFAATVGAARKSDGIPFENHVTERELESATSGAEGKSVTRVMVELGVVKHKDWGGDRRDKAAKNGKTVGRKPKDAAAEALAAARDPDLSWAEVSDYLRGLYRFGMEEDSFGNLADDDLESLSVRLAALAKRASDLLAARRSGGMRALGATKMPAAEATAIIERGL